MVLEKEEDIQLSYLRTRLDIRRKTPSYPVADTWNDLATFKTRLCVV